MDANGVVQLSGLDAGGFWSQAALGIVSDGESLHLYDRELSLLQGWVAVGEIDGDLVVSTVDGVFRFGPDGSAQRVASGRPLALSEAILVVLSCDDAMRCGPSSVDLRTGVTSRLPELSGPVVAASVSPDGSRIILGAAATPSEVEAFVLLGDSWVPLVSDGAWHVGTAVWGDGGAMWWDPDRHRLVAVTLQGDQVGTEVLPLGVDVHSAVVVPRADLPQLWRDALDAAS